MPISRRTALRAATALAVSAPVGALAGKTPSPKDAYVYIIWPQDGHVSQRLSGISRRDPTSSRSFGRTTLVSQLIPHIRGQAHREHRAPGRPQGQ